MSCAWSSLFEVLKMSKRRIKSHHASPVTTTHPISRENLCYPLRSLAKILSDQSGITNQASPTKHQTPNTKNYASSIKHQASNVT